MHSIQDTVTVPTNAMHDDNKMCDRKYDKLLNKQRICTSKNGTISDTPGGGGVSGLLVRPLSYEHKPEFIYVYTTHATNYTYVHVLATSSIIYMRRW
jgi:hypothetical protein